jgi:hypothetical protein
MLPLCLFEGKLSIVVVSEVIQRTELRWQAILGLPLVVRLARYSLTLTAVHSGWEYSEQDLMYSRASSEEIASDSR